MDHCGCEAVTVAAVLRFSLRAFGGIGHVAAETPNKIPEQPDTAYGHGRTSPVMWIPAIALVAASLTVGAFGRVPSILLNAASRFINHEGYARTVLDGKPMSAPLALPAPHPGPLNGALALCGAVAIALAAVFREPNPPRPSAVAAVGRWIRNAHSGHVGDYITWLTLDISMLSAALLLLLRA